MKTQLSELARSKTAMRRQWIAGRLRMGSASCVSTQLNAVDNKL
jgi:hypothetical protein